MKEYKLKDTVYHQIEHIKECSYTRMHELHSHLVFAEYGHTPADFIEKMDGVEKAYDEGSKRDFIIYMHEGKKCLQNILDKYDADEHIFALLILTDEEVKDESNPRFVDMGYLKKKIEKFREEGLMRVNTIEINAFFLMNSRQHSKLGSLRVLQRYISYLQTLTIIESVGVSSDANSD